MHNIIKDDKTIYDLDKLKELCLKVSEQDIDSDTLLNHYLFIQENNIKYFIKLKLLTCISSLS